MHTQINAKRIRAVNPPAAVTGPVIYWMSREQRVSDNWALLHARNLALENRVGLAVVFCLVPAFLDAPWRAYWFMLTGLREASRRLAVKNIPFFLLLGDPTEEVPAFAGRHRCGAVVVDFDPLRIKRHWKTQVAAKISVPMVEVDARNIVPCRHASDKQEFGAYTLRPKLARLLPEFLTDVPRLRAMQGPAQQWPAPAQAIDWDMVAGSLPADRSVPAVDWCTPGEQAARRAMRHFLRHRLPRYHEQRNDPCRDGQSGLSPYLHFGHLSAQRLAWEVRHAAAPRAAKEAFLEELIVRRELADNLCCYNTAYDSVAGFPQWARQTLDEHRADRRAYCYTGEELENSLTHDPLWNAAQRQMVVTGRMHGYLRMYWCKKILEWTPSPEEALACAIRLNDRYELDGRDPNGYAGIAWSIGGVHDRPWPQRPVFGKIRYMSYKGCSAKFDIAAYCKQYSG
jgi:deoxyribodipyrimidine photo-lyase